MFGTVNVQLNSRGLNSSSSSTEIVNNDSSIFFKISL